MTLIFNTVITMNAIAPADEKADLGTFFSKIRSQSVTGDVSKTWYDMEAAEIVLPTIFFKKGSVIYTVSAVQQLNFIFSFRAPFRPSMKLLHSIINPAASRND